MEQGAVRFGRHKFICTGYGLEGLGRLGFTCLSEPCTVY